MPTKSRAGTAPSKKDGKKKMVAKKKGDAKGKVSKSKSSKKVKKKTRPKSSSTSIEDLLKLEESIEQRGKAKNRTRAAFEQSKIAVDLAAEALLQGGGAGEGAGKTTANNYNLSSIDVFEESLADFQRGNAAHQKRESVTSPVSSAISALNSDYGGVNANPSIITSSAWLSPKSTSTATKKATHRAKKSKKMTASQQRKRSHFHYLGGSVSLQAERERRMELEERLMEARDEVRKQAETLLPTVEALVGAVRAIEEGFDQQLVLADETQNTFESLRNEISTLRHELKKDLRKTKDHSRELLAVSHLALFLILQSPRRTIHQLTPFYNFAFVQGKN